MRPPLALLSLNVNGLRDAKKRIALFSALRGGHWDVDPHGPFLMVDFRLGDSAFTVVSVYAPVEPPLRAAFFRDQLGPNLPADRLLLIGGDFNCIQDPVWDQQGAHSAAGRTVGYAGGLAEVQAQHALADVWRELNLGASGRLG
ncbi:hypothetical protein WJX73_001451 [Symbiochloris irregularis]|uniref:Uncharacterized protein n=1 Tax=Symbiochloris irregularis TaxID=706552 RepID=A0AAW1NXW8_9CHLO